MTVYLIIVLTKALILHCCNVKKGFQYKFSSTSLTNIRSRMNCWIIFISSKIIIFDVINADMKPSKNTNNYFMPLENPIKIAGNCLLC